MYTSPEDGPDRPWNRTVYRALFAVAFVALGIALVAGGSSASVGPNATEIDACTEIEEGGEYVITEDLQPSAPANLSLDTGEYTNSACIAVNASSVVIDGQGHEINGSAIHVNVSTEYYGIRVQNLSDAANGNEESALSAYVANVTLTQWSRGVYAENGDGVGVNETTIQSDVPGQNGGVHFAASVNSSVRHTVIDGPSVGIRAFSSGSGYINVTHNDVSNTSLVGIEASADDLVVANNTVDDFSDSSDAIGIEIEESGNARIVDNVVRDGFQAILAYGSPESDYTISNNTVIEGARGIEIDDAVGTPSPGSASAVLRNNTVDDFTHGIDVQWESASPTIVDNIVTNVSAEGIHVFGDSDGGLVESNVVTDSGTGLRFRADHTTVEDNDFSGNDRAVDLRRSEDSTIRRNDLSGSDTVGAYLFGANQGTVVSNNTITESNGTGVEITVLNDDTSDVVLEGNEITRNQAEGVLVDNENAPSEPGPRDPVIRGNNISANGAEGIFDRDGINATYADNRVANNTGRGIYLRDYARNATVRNNTVVDNGGVGIQLGQDPSGGTPNVTVEENSLANNSDHAILIEDESAGIIVANNSMSDHDVDLRLHQVSGVTVHDNTFGTGIAFGVEDDGDFVHEISGNAFHDGSPLYYAAGDAAPSVPQDARQVIVVDADGLALADLDLTTDEVPTGVLVATSNGSTIENVTVEGPAQQGVRLVSVANATVDGATVDGARRGIVVETSPGIDLRNASVTNVAGSDTGSSDGIDVTDSTGAAVRDSYVHNTTGIGIEISQTEDFLLESSSVDETGSSGVFVSNSTEANVRSSSVLDATDAGVLLDGASNSTVEGMVVTSSPSATRGIRVLDSDEITLHDNHVEGIGGEGITTANAHNVTIIGTFAYDNDVGIAVGTGNYNGDANAVLRQNELIQNDLGLDGQEIVELVNNTIRDSTNDGAFVDNSDGVTITHNSIRRNGVNGLELDVLFDVTVGNNEFDDNDVAIHDGGSVGLLIDTNTFRNHDNQSVELYGTDEFTVRNNTIEDTVDSDGYGISAGVRTELASGDVGTIADNTFDSNDVGVQVAPENTDLLGANLTIRDNEFVENAEGVEVYAETDEVVITNNAFNATDNVAVAYDADSPTNYLDARQNWWGAADGPSGSESDPVTGAVANGSGGSVEANVRFDPWLGDNSSVGSNLTADISVVDASLDRTDVEPNGAVIVSVDVQNVGNASGSYDVDLEIDGTVEDTTTVTVAPSVTETVEFTHAFAATGEYDVTVSGVTAGTVTVAESGSGGGGDDGGDDGGDGGTGGGFVPGPAPTPDPGPHVTVDDTDAGADVTVTNVQASDSVTVPLNGTIQSDGVGLTALEITLSEAVDFEATVEANESAPANAGDLPNDAEAIAYLDVSHGFDDDQIEGATVEFTVTTGALADRGLDPENVALYHSVDGEWIEHETTVVEEQEDVVDFRADVPHFSWFAVAGVQSTGSETDDGGSDGSDDPGGDETATGAADSDGGQSSGSGGDSDDGSPGFGVLVALGALLGVVLLSRRYGE